MEFATPAIFQERLVPANAQLAGWAALVHNLRLEAPVRQPSVVSMAYLKGGRKQENDWTVLEKRLRPGDSLAGHLTFALRHEPIDLLILRKLFRKVEVQKIEEIVRSEPTGAISRRLWFLHEWMTGDLLDLPDAAAGNYVDVLNPKEYFTTAPVNSPRHRVRNNLLGTPEFCPIVRRTADLDEAVGARWDAQAKELVGKIKGSVVARAASFLLLADSQASYRIEGERPARNRLERWMRAVAQAGKAPLSIDELVRLQHVVIEDNRFIKPGLRDEGGFIGDRDQFNDPLPEFISARPEDIQSLLDGIISASRRMSSDGVDPVIQAAAIAFAFVVVHPFVDGNGRIHRYLIHHVLAERGYAPSGMVFPVSSVLLDRIEEYGERLRAFSGPLMPFIEWRPTPTHNVQVINDTSDLYRYGDYTDLAEFIYRCVVRTITTDLPREIQHLRSFDEAKRRIQDIIDMPDSLLSNLIQLVQQNDGKLPKKRRRKDFVALTEDEVATVEQAVSEAFGLPIVEDPNEPREDR